MPRAQAVVAVAIGIVSAIVAGGFGWCGLMSAVEMDIPTPAAAAFLSVKVLIRSSNISLIWLNVEVNVLRWARFLPATLTGLLLSSSIQA